MACSPGCIRCSYKEIYHHPVAHVESLLHLPVTARECFNTNQSLFLIFYCLSSNLCTGLYLSVLLYCLKFEVLFFLKKSLMLTGLHLFNQKYSIRMAFIPVMLFLCWSFGNHRNMLLVKYEWMNEISSGDTHVATRFYRFEACVCLTKLFLFCSRMCDLEWAGTWLNHRLMKPTSVNMNWQAHVIHLSIWTHA